MIKIIKLNEMENEYSINGKGICAENIPYFKKVQTHFTTQELNELENYIKAEKNEYKRNIT